jgi:hypothetical protein
MSICRPIAKLAECASVISDLAFRLFGLTSTAKRAAFGNSSCNIPNRFAATSIPMSATPVALPPGRLRLATRPIWTGSPAVLKTIGIVLVAALAASAAVPPRAAMATTWRRTRSAANSESRALSFCAERNSIARLRPSN